MRCEGTIFWKMVGFSPFLQLTNSKFILNEIKINLDFNTIVGVIHEFLLCTREINFG